MVKTASQHSFHTFADHNSRNDIWTVSSAERSDNSIPLMDSSINSAIIMPLSFNN